MGVSSPFATPQKTFSIFAMAKLVRMVNFVTILATFAIVKIRLISQSL
jgi:hypothetical protein